MSIKGEKELNRNSRVRKIQANFLVFFTVMIFAITAVLTGIILRQSTAVVRNNASSLIATNSAQIQFNINSYLDKVETTSALLFSDEAYYKYDATDAKYDEYSRIQHEKEISNRIVDLGIMQNFSDFGIIYSNNNTVGWISNTSKNIFKSDTRYDDVVSHITNEKKNDGWFFGVGDNFDRLYYVKRINKNAVLLASFYNRELATVFNMPDELDGMVIRLINDESQILYSSNTDEIGAFLPDNIKERIGNSHNRSYIDNDNIINVDTCGNGWRVVCVMPLSNVLVDTNQFFLASITIAVIVAIIFIAMGLMVFEHISKPIATVVADLEKRAAYDDLSGMLNKPSFRANVNEIINTLTTNQIVAYAIMDVDHFKNINDTLGHAYGDEVITRTGKVIRDSLGEDILAGRIGGDEFAIWFSESYENTDKAAADIAKKLDVLSNEFLKEFAKEHESCEVSLSIGVTCIEYNGEAYDEMYMNADSALYVSKKNGRNQYTFYKEGMDNEA